MSVVDPDLAIKSHARSVKAVMDCVHERECAIALARADEAAGELGRWLDGEGRALRRSRNTPSSRPSMLGTTRSSERP